MVCEWLDSSADYKSTVHDMAEIKIPLSSIMMKETACKPFLVRQMWWSLRVLDERAPMADHKPPRLTKRYGCVVPGAACPASWSMKHSGSPCAAQILVWLLDPAVLLASAGPWSDPSARNAAWQNRCLSPCGRTTIIIMLRCRKSSRQT